MYGIQVNIGTVPTPDWRWVHSPGMQRVTFNTEHEAAVQKELWYPGVKGTVFRVKEIEE